LDDPLATATTCTVPATVSGGAMLGDSRMVTYHTCGKTMQ
jgi:hypothetical protein